MRRLLPFLAVACAPLPEEFEDAYWQAYCDAFERHCAFGVPAPAPCRPTGVPTDVVPPLPAGCDYDRGAADACLDLSRWSCEPGGGLVDDAFPQPPDVCFQVWTCEGAG